jgi:acyl homoserine lactone synthase
MFKLRNEVFHKRLGWDVKSRADMEMDEYDDLDPIYIVAQDTGLSVNGCCRLLPTTGPYMLKDIFPQLLRGEEIPNDPAVWELSRFALRPNAHNDVRQANLSAVTFRMLQKGVDYAMTRGIQSYIFATSVAMERIFRMIGIPIRRFGDKRATQVGKVLSVACWVDINEETHRAVYGNFRYPQIEREAA